MSTKEQEKRAQEIEQLKQDCAALERDVDDAHQLQVLADLKKHKATLESQLAEKRAAIEKTEKATPNAKR